MSPRIVVSIALAAVGAAALFAPPARAEVRSGETVVVDTGETITENLYARGSTVLIHGRVQGDVVAAGGSIVIDGQVEGDVLAAGGDVTIAGTVAGDVRAAGGRVFVRAPVGGDVTAAAGELRIDNSVAGHAMLAGGNAQLTGNIGGGLTAAVGELRVEGQVGENIMMQGGMLTLGSGAQVGGDVVYPDNATFLREPGAVVAGALVPQAISRAESTAVGVVFALQLLVGLAALGLLWLLLFRGYARRTMNTLREHPGKAAGVGAVFFFFVPLALFIVFVVGAIVGGWWLALFGLSLYGFSILLAFPVVAAFVGQAVARRMGRTPSDSLIGELVPMVGALLALILVMQIPVIGFLVSLAVILFGLGALTLALLPTLRANRARARAPVTTTTTTTTSTAEPLGAT